jgi:hypothetical protein
MSSVSGVPACFSKFAKNQVQAVHPPATTDESGTRTSAATRQPRASRRGSLVTRTARRRAVSRRAWRPSPPTMRSGNNLRSVAAAQRLGGKSAKPVKSADIGGFPSVVSVSSVGSNWTCPDFRVSCPGAVGGLIASAAPTPTSRGRKCSYPSVRLGVFPLSESWHRHCMVGREPGVHQSRTGAHGGHLWRIEGLGTPQRSLS